MLLISSVSGTDPSASTLKMKLHDVDAEGSVPETLEINNIAAGTCP